MIRLRSSRLSSAGAATFLWSTRGSLCAMGAATNAPRLRLASDTCSYLAASGFFSGVSKKTFLECFRPGTRSTRMSSTLGPNASMLRAASSSFHANVSSFRLRRFQRIRTSLATAASRHESICSLVNRHPRVVLNTRDAAVTLPSIASLALRAASSRSRRSAAAPASFMASGMLASRSARLWSARAPIIPFRPGVMFLMILAPSSSALSCLSSSMSSALSLNAPTDDAAFLNGENADTAETALATKVTDLARFSIFSTRLLSFASSLCFLRSAGVPMGGPFSSPGVAVTYGSRSRSPCSSAATSHGSRASSPRRAFDDVSSSPLFIGRGNHATAPPRLSTCGAYPLRVRAYPSSEGGLSTGPTP